jgi:hypothetical protein
VHSRLRNSIKKVSRIGIIRRARVKIKRGVIRIIKEIKKEEIEKIKRRR